MTSATIKLFLPRGDAKSLRTAEISNWTGKAVAAPRTELDELLARENSTRQESISYWQRSSYNAPRLTSAGGGHSRSTQATQDKGVLGFGHRLRDQGREPDQGPCEVSRRPPPREAAQIKRFTLEQNQAGGSKLPESDREDMEVFLARIRQLLPVLGSDILAPISQPAAKAQPGGVLFCRNKGAEARAAYGEWLRRIPGFHCRLGGTPIRRDLSLRVARANNSSPMARLSTRTAFGLHQGCGVFQSICGGGCQAERKRTTAWKTEGGKSLKQLTNRPASGSRMADRRRRAIVLGRSSLYSPLVCEPPFAGAREKYD